MYPSFGVQLAAPQVIAALIPAVHAVVNGAHIPERLPATLYIYHVAEQTN
jgi:hypothetical protein